MSHLVLSSDALSIKISTLGAELQSLYSKKLEHELLWQADPLFWPRHAPILFPIVGKLANNQLISNGKAYPLTQHGFARDAQFEIIFQSDSLIQLQLNASDETLEQYPYPFELMVEYSLKEDTLRTTFVIRNNSENPLPFSIGGHPAFNWPLVPSVDKASHKILFEQDESESILQLENGLIASDRRTSPLNNRELPISESLFEKDALIFDTLNSQKISYQAGSRCTLDMVFGDFPQLGIWKKPGAGFICLEPWAGYASPTSFMGEFSEKPGNVTLPAYSEAAFSFDLVVRT